VYKKHQPQHDKKLCGHQAYSSRQFCEVAAAGPALRDTAALRGQCYRSVAAGILPAVSGGILPLGRLNRIHIMTSLPRQTTRLEAGRYSSQGWLPLHFAMEAGPLFRYGMRCIRW
jgi:hypothetical protein